MTTPVSISFKIEKASPTGRYVSGWLSVVEKDGKVIEDTQGDRISMEELEKGVHKYMAGSRVIKKQHSGDKIGEMVEIMIIDDAVAKSLGMTTTKRGAWGKAEITDEATRESVRKGEVNGWSMGGAGKRKPIEKAGLLRTSSLGTRRGLLRRSIKNNAAVVARTPGAAEFSRKLGRAQSYLSRRAMRVSKASDGFGELYDAIEKAGLRTALRHIDPTRRARLNVARTAARLRSEAPGKRRWYRGVQTSNHSLSRISNRSGNAWASSRSETANRFAGKGRGAAVLPLKTRGRYFDHDNAAHRKALSRSERSVLPSPSTPRDQVGPRYNTSAARSALKRRGFHGVEFAVGGAHGTVRYAFGHNAEKRWRTHFGKSKASALYAEITKARELRDV